MKTSNRREKKGVITSWAFWGEEEEREVTRESHENWEELNRDEEEEELFSSESSVDLIREIGSLSNLATRGVLLL